MMSYFKVERKREKKEHIAQSTVSEKINDQSVLLYILESYNL